MEIPSFKTVVTATSKVEAVCLVQSAYKAKVTWLRDGTAASPTDQENEENGTVIVSKLKVSPSEWKELKSVTCKAEHPCFSATDETVNVKGKKQIICLASHRLNST